MGVNNVRKLLVLLTCLLLPAHAFAKGDLVDVQKRTLVLKDFRLQNGEVLPEVTIAFETYGDLALDGRNAILLTHGYTNSQKAAGAYPGEKPSGSWNEYVGPGKVIDTDKVFVVSANMLGSSWGSTSPAFTNPKTGKPYGPDFPDITVVDIINTQYQLLQHLGVKHLIAVVGASYGGYQAFQWSVSYPDFVDGIVPVVSAPHPSPTTGNQQDLDDLVKRLSEDPNWNGGDYYAKGGVLGTTTQMRIETLKEYGIEQQLIKQFPEEAAREAEIQRQAEVWARAFDANSLIVLKRAEVRWSVLEQLKAVKAKVLYVLISSDKVFPPSSIAKNVMDKMKSAGVDAEYLLVESDLGHIGYAREAGKIGPKIRELLARLAPNR